MKLSNPFKSILLLLISLSFISCGSSSQMVTDVSVDSRVQDGEVLLDLVADLNIGNLQMPNVSLPITSHGEYLGEVNLNSPGFGENQIEINLNVSRATDLNLISTTLPNGMALPVIRDNPVIVVPVGNGGELYIGLSDNNVAIGVAIPIKSFDKMGRKLGTITLMPYFNKNNIVGSAGVYTSPNAGENGFAFIADVSSKLLPLVESKDISFNSPNLAQLEQKSVSKQYSSKRERKRVKRELYKMHRRRTKLKIK